MANPVKGETPLALQDGRRFTLVLDMGAMIEAEARYGKPIDRLMGDVKAGFLGALAALVQGALARFHPTLSRDDVLDILQTDNDVVVAALDVATAAAFPDAKPSAEGKGGRRPAGTNSGASGAKPVSTPKPSGKPRRARSISKSAPG